MIIKDCTIKHKQDLHPILSAILSRKRLRGNPGSIKNVVVIFNSYGAIVAQVLATVKSTS